MSEYPQYDTADVKEWLTTVFGEDVIFDTQAVARYRTLDGKQDNDLGGWTLYYTGDLFLQADLPPEQSQLLAATLRTTLERAMIRELVPNYYSISGIENRNKAYREAVTKSGLPFPEDVIRDDLFLNTKLLKKLAGSIKEPAEYVQDFTRHVQTREEEWIKRKETLEHRCAVAFLGREPDKDVKGYFRYNRPAGNYSGVELAFLLPEMWPPVFPEQDANGNELSAYDWERYWIQRSQELGLEGLFRYSNFYVGTHAPIEEQKLVLYADSDMDISNKMDVLLAPENLANAQLYFNEVLGSTLTKIWLDDYHPHFRSELHRAWDKVKDTDKATDKDKDKERQNIFENIQNSRKHVQWRDTVPELVEAYPTTAAFIKAVHSSAPRGQKNIYKTLCAWSENTFPLLTKAIAEGRFEPKPAVAPVLPEPSTPAV